MTGDRLKAITATEINIGLETAFLRKSGFDFCSQNSADNEKTFKFSIDYSNSRLYYSFGLKMLHEYSL